MKEQKCNCTVTQGKEGETGSWCVKCGRKVLEIETRPCELCKNFSPDQRVGTCTKLLMLVPSNMRVTFHVSNGTCFEPITIPNI